MKEPPKALPRSVEELIPFWRAWAREYDERDREATRRKEYVIAAQQGGISAMLFRCANELETVLKISDELRSRAGVLT